MATTFHHTALFVADMEKSLHIFQDILGMELLWRMGPLEDPQLAQFLCLDQPKVDVELAFLKLGDGAQGLELVCLRDPVLDPAPSKLGRPGTFCLSYFSQDLPALSKRLEQAGCLRCTPELRVVPPQGKPVKILSLRTEDGITLELIGPDAESDSK